MLHPTIDELTKDRYNRYELALATARCARLITNEYVRQHEAAERAQTGNKETDRPINTLIEKELRDEKAVKVAISKIYSGEYEIDLNAAEHEKEREAEERRRAEEAEAVAEGSGADPETEADAEEEPAAEAAEPAEEAPSENE